MCRQMQKSWRVVSCLTKSGVGFAMICNSGGGCQTVGTCPAGIVIGLTNRMESTGESSVSDLPIGVGVLKCQKHCIQGGQQ